MSELPQPPRTPWRTIRAMLVALHVAAVVVGAFPAPVGGLNRAAWSEPTVKAELDAWHQRLQGMGLTADRATFEDGLYSLASTWVRGRQQVVKPFRPYYRYVGTEQSWRMFVAPHKHPSRLQVQVRVQGAEAEAWQTIFEQDNSEFDWRANQFLHTRMRSSLFRYSWPGYQRSFKALSTWIGRRVAEERPEVTHVRVQWLRRRTASPAKMRAGELPPEKVVRAQTLELAKLEP